MAERKRRGTIKPGEAGRPRAFEPETVADALLKTAGIQTAAAQLLGTSHTLIGRYIRDYPDIVGAAYTEARVGIVDLAESQLLLKLREGHWPAIKFVLQTLGRDRGWNPDADIVAEVQKRIRAYAESDPNLTYESAIAEVQDIMREARRNGGF